MQNTQNTFEQSSENSYRQTNLVRLPGSSGFMELKFEQSIEVPDEVVFVVSQTFVIADSNSAENHVFHKGSSYKGILSTMSIFLEDGQVLDLPKETYKNIELSGETWVQFYKCFNDNKEKINVSTFVYPGEATVAITQYKKDLNKIKIV